jgi:membrane fusion protein (multidrug efflux system)
MSPFAYFLIAIVAELAIGAIACGLVYAARKQLLTVRALALVLGGIFLVVDAVAGWKVYTVQAIIAKMSAQKPPATVVSSIKASAEAWQERLHAVGSLTAVQGVTVSNELDGLVTQVAFESGATVKKDDLLVQLDVSQEQAELVSAIASADLARLNQQRAQELRAKGSNAQSDLDAAEAQARQTAAAIDVIRATIAKKTIRAPFAGRLGIRQVNLGQFIKAGTAVVSLQLLDPIYVDFSLPQQDVVNLQAGQAVQVAIDAFPGEGFAGKINALNSRVDDANRNIQVQGTLGNADGKLRPGMFAGVDVLLPQQNDVVTLPQTAIVYNPYGNAVYVVEKAKDQPGGGETTIARQRFVQLGETRGDQVAVLKGVKVGEEIVTSGQLKLRNGTPIEINNSVAPGSNPAPMLPNN